MSQAFQFFMPIGAGAGLHLPSSMFIGQTGDRRASPDLSADEQLACHWKKVRSHFYKPVASRPGSKISQYHHNSFTMTDAFRSPSAIYSLTPCKTWWTMSTTSMSSPRRTLGTAVTGRAALEKGGVSMLGEKIMHLGNWLSVRISGG